MPRDRTPRCPGSGRLVPLAWDQNFGQCSKCAWRGYYTHTERGARVPTHEKKES